MQNPNLQVAYLQALFLDVLYKQYKRDMRSRVTDIPLPKTCPKKLSTQIPS